MQKNLNPIKKSSDIRINHHLSQFKNEFLSPSKKSEHLHSLSQAKPRMNVIKINKGKLPHDFFPKCLSFEKKLPNFRLNLKQQEKEFNIHKPRRVQSQRLHNSPEKTSFFGFFEGQNLVTRQPFGSSSKTISLKRKFQTREQPKRDNSQMKRRFTPGSNIQRNDLLDLFPASYDQQFTEIITSNSSARMAKLSPRKQYIGKYQQQVYDPQKEDLGQRMGRSQFDANGFDVINGARLSPQKNVINLKTIEKTYPQTLRQTLRQSDRNRQQQSFIQPQTVDLHNMTFFNAKSSCLPPIKKI